MGIFEGVFPSLDTLVITLIFFHGTRKGSKPYAVRFIREWIIDFFVKLTSIKKARKVGSAN